MENLDRLAEMVSLETPAYLETKEREGLQEKREREDPLEQDREDREDSVVPLGHQARLEPAPQVLRALLGLGALLVAREPQE